MTTAPDLRSPVAGERFLARVVAAVRDRDPDAADALQRAFATAVDEGVELGVALGLAADWRAIRARARRDQLLRTMWQRWFPADRPATASARIHLAIVRYAAMAWPRERFQFPARREGTIEGDAWQVLSTGAAMLAERQIRRILEESTS